ncbi:hypothetical protein [Cytobacillus sp.]|uniref:hypothetical protein n=1 Tax=Cytobacillus sp. TaxID=2675269 RepID=UPI0028BD35DB|nr:hypothetical protein [Cytobacillus sp.]
MSDDNMKHLDPKTDPLTSFMFGNSRYKEKQDDINNVVEEDESREFDHDGKRKSERDWLFGVRENEIQEKNHDSSALAILNRINLGELINNIEILIDSADQLKPLYKKATPIITKLLKKS